MNYLVEIVDRKEKSIGKFLLWWGLLFVLSILVRLPHFLSDNFWFDGDEAIIGLMAQDLLKGENFPFYFYGQNYGLSTFEVFSTAFFEALSGPNIWSLRLGGLLLFSLGITFVARTIRVYGLPRWVFFSFIILLLTFPAWYLWGTMVRGGYVTAFLFVCIIFYFILQKEQTRSQLVWIAISSAIAFESHFLILLAFSPLIVWWLLRQDKILIKTFTILIIFIGTAAVFRIGYLDEPFWEPPAPSFGWDKQLINLQSQKHGFIAGFSNFFYFEMNVDRPFWWDLLLKLFLGLSSVYLLWGFVRSSRFQKKFYMVLVLAVVAYIFLISTIQIRSPRYWMGLFNGLLFVLIFVAVYHRRGKFSFLFIGVFSLISLIGIAVGPKMRQHWYEANVNELRAFEGFHKAVKNSGAKALYVTDNLIQYQWNYLYGDEIPASTFRTKGERVQKFCDRVNEIYKNYPEEVVLGGLWGLFATMDTIQGFNDHRLQVETKYFIHPYARKNFVEQGMRTVREEGG